jgi:DNA-binding beta-propeller fold protein YncE
LGVRVAAPEKVCVAPGGRVVAVADTGGGRVLVLTLDGDVVAEHAAVRPAGVRFGRGDDLLVCEPDEGRLIAVSPEGTRRVVAAGLVRPVDVAVAADGGAFVADADADVVHVVRADGSLGVLTGGRRGLVDGPRGTGRLSGPSAIALGAQGAFVTDERNHALRIVDGRGGIATLVGRGVPGDTDGLPPAARLCRPAGVVPAPDGSSVYVADTGNDRLRFWSGVDGELSSLPVEGLRRPGGIDVLPDGRLVVADTGNDRVVVVDLATGAVTTLLG